MQSKKRPASPLDAHSTVRAIVHEVTLGNIKAIEAADRIVRLGYLLIGTARLDVALHVPPRPNVARSFNIDLRKWEDTTTEEGKGLLRATNLVPHAILCALFGDPNDRGQRKRLMGSNGPLTTEPPPHFGWSRDGRVVHAIPDLIRGAITRGTALQGAIDVIQDDGSFWPDITSVGTYFSPNEHATIAHIPVNGTDLPDIRIVAYNRPLDPPDVE